MFRSGEAKVIPKTVFQTYKDSRLAVPLAENLVRNLQFAVGWSHRLFDDEMIPEYVRAAFGANMAHRYRAIAPEYGAARADLFRYLFAYQEGGVYLDIKSQLTRQLSDVIQVDDCYLLGCWHNCGEAAYASYGRDSTIANPAGEFQQWFLVAAPRHPFLEAVIHEVCRRIDTYTRRSFGFGKWGTINTTGPIPYTNAIYPILGQHAHRRVRSYTDLGFRYSMFDAPDLHHQVLASHYTKNSGPVVRHPPTVFARNLIRSALGSVRRRMQG